MLTGTNDPRLEKISSSSGVTWRAREKLRTLSRIHFLYQRLSSTGRISMLVRRESSRM